MNIKLIKILGEGWTQRLKWLMIGLLIASLLEVMTVAVIYPFLKVVIGGESQNQPEILILCIIFCLAIIVSSFFRIYISWLSGKYAFGIGKNIANKIYKNFIFTNYEIYEKTSLDFFSTVISKKIDILVQQSILPSVILMVNLLICLGIIALIFYIDIVIALCLVFFVVFSYLMIGIISKKKLLLNGKKSSEKLIELNQILDVTYAGFVENKIYSNESFFYNKFKEIYDELNESQRKLDIMRTYPRYFIEALGVISLFLCGFIMVINGKKLDSVLPTLGVVAFAAQRLLPCAQLIYNSWSAIKSAEPIYYEIYSFLKFNNNELKSINNSEVIFENIVIENASFKYSTSQNFILDKINLKFNAGDRVGIIGLSGSGKSTFLKLLIGLIQPNEGRVYLNSDLPMPLHRGELWKKVSYISQNLTIYPGTIIENIGTGFEIKDIDIDKVIRVTKSAKIFEFIDQLPSKFETKIGGGNFMPSNGQIQRIILARALYRDPELIILDEFTSALDTDTESKILDEIMELFSNKSIIMISHKKETLKLCKKIFLLENSGLDEYVKF